jgi:hypothetical protein
LIEATILQLSRRLPHSISNLEMLSTPPDENQTAERTGFPIGGIDVLILWAEAIVRWSWKSPARWN